MKRIQVKISLLLIIVIVIIINLFVDRDKTFKVISNDVLSYYSYLPATFIYKDITLKFIDNDKAYFADKIWADTLSNGNYQIRTTMGVAVMYSPFFFTAHSILKLSGGLTDGFSEMYSNSLIVASLFYFFIGLYFLAKILEKFFSLTVTSITLILITFSTNLLVNVTIYAAMSHAFSFCLISVFIYYVIKWYEENSWRTSLVLGAVYGLITLVRPTNAIVIVFFAFYGIESLDIFKQRIKFWYRNWAQILAFVSVIVVIWIPQFIYWHKITGSWLHNSYEKSGSEFFFSNPQVINQLFSFRKGLLLYSPLIGLAFLGVLSLYWYQRRLFLAVLLFTILNIYVLSSWWAWWFGGGFGPRLYTDSYAMMGIGLASFLTLIRKSHLALKLSVSLIIGFFLFLSLFQSYQFYKGKLHYVAMTKESYMASFLNLNPGKAYYNNLVDPNLKNAKKGVYYKDERTYQEVFEQNSEIEKIKQIEFYIRNTPDYLEAVRKKALKRNISIDSMIRIDALWVLEMEKSKNSRK